MADRGIVGREQLVAARRALSLSQEGLARRLGVSFATVNRWERGRTRPRGPVLDALAAILSLADASSPAADSSPPGVRRPDGDDLELLDLLTIFPASFSIDAAEAVAGPREAGGASTLARLGALAADSVVEVRPGPAGLRYSLASRARADIVARPGFRPSGDAAQRLSDWCLGFVHRAERGMAGREQDHWLRVAALEADAIGLSIEHAAATGDAARAIELGAGFWRFWYSVSDLATGRRLLATALGIRGPVPAALRARALFGSGVIARQLGDLDEAIGYFHEHLTVARSSGDDRSIAQAHNSLAGVLHQAGNVSRARQLLLASLDWWQRTRDRDGMAAALSNLGVVASDGGELEAAREFGEQALSLRLAIGNAEGIAISCENLATVALRAGDVLEAARMFREALRRYADLDELDGVAAALDGLVLVLPDAVAARLLPVADELRARIPVGRDRDVADRLAARSEQLTATDPATTRPGTKAGELSLEVAIELALAGAAADEPLATRLRGRLTPREREVLGLVTAGWTSKEIAGRLGLSSRTVEHHLANVYAKVGARGRADAIAFGVRMGLGS